MHEHEFNISCLPVRTVFCLLLLDMGLASSPEYTALARQHHITATSTKSLSELRVHDDTNVSLDDMILHTPSVACHNIY
jgi:hypothetical protein